jgi:hypothetical protein
LANRVLIGNRATGGQGLYVSAKGQDVLTCADKHLILDARTKRAGQIYRTGNQSSISSSGLTWTDSNAPSLGFIPLILVIEQEMGDAEIEDNVSPDLDADWESSQVSVWASTETTLRPVSSEFDPNGYSGAVYSLGGRSGTNVRFFVLRIPCQYGKMTTSSLWT